MWAGAVLLLCLAVTGCEAVAQRAEVSAGCDAAFDDASAAMNKHYKTHPLFGPEYDELYADGTIDKKEQKTLDKLMADEQTKFAAAIDPIYDACTSVEELYSGAYSHRDDADWALLDTPNMTQEEIKKIFVVSHCSIQAARPACSDYDEDDWR